MLTMLIPSVSKINAQQKQHFFNWPTKKGVLRKQDQFYSLKRCNTKQCSFHLPAKKLYYKSKTDVILQQCTMEAKQIMFPSKERWTTKAWEILFSNKKVNRKAKQIPFDSKERCTMKVMLILIANRRRPFM